MVVKVHFLLLQSISGFSKRRNGSVRFSSDFAKHDLLVPSKCNANISENANNMTELKHV